MKVLYSWLREMVPIGLAPQELAEALSLAGTVVERCEPTGEDWVLELDLTSNRPDCLSHYGIAREIAAITATRLTPLRAEELSTDNKALRVTIESPEACGRYCAVVLEEVTVAPSPAAIAERLTRLGQRAINNIADLTNYTLWEMGHPTHAFDLDRLRGGELIVRRARAGETLVTLDEIERRLTPEDLVIADAERPVALAGVMGGLEASISATTTRVALESAWFDPLTVRRCARRHGLHTDASHRFERGADPEAAPLAAELIAGRVRGYGARLRGGLVEANGQRPAVAAIRLRAVTLERILGVSVPGEEVERILHSLGCRREGEAWQPPSWRPDLTREIDLVEEVARLYGYHNFPARLPVFQGVAEQLPEVRLRERVRQQLRGRGFAESITLSFAAEAECRRFAPESRPVRVLNPLNDEAAILRTSSLPALLQLLRNNIHHGVAAPRLFEIGKTYRIEGSEPVETPVLSLGTCDAEMDFAGMKGEVEAVLDIFAAQPPAIARADGAWLHPGRAATFGSLAVWGQLHPRLAAEWKLPDTTWVAEIQLQSLYESGARPVHYRPPSRYPASERDFSFIFADATTWGEIEAAIGQPAIAALIEVKPVEIYRGANVGAGHYSLLLRARFQSEERTLRDAEVNQAADALTGRLQRLGGRQRQ